MAYHCSSARNRGKGCVYKKCTRSRAGSCSYATWSIESVNRSGATSEFRHSNISVERLTERTYRSFVARDVAGGSVRGLGRPRLLDREAPIVYPEPYIGVRDRLLGPSRCRFPARRSASDPWSGSPVASTVSMPPLVLSKATLANWLQRHASIPWAVGSIRFSKVMILTEHL